MNLIERDTIKSINQNISIILTTPKGSDPHRPLFGSNIWQFIDKPLTAITKGRLKKEIVDAISLWEPRVEVEEINLKKEYTNIKITFKYRIKDTEEINTEEITV